MPNWRDKVRDEVAAAFVEPASEPELSRALAFAAAAAARGRGMSQRAYVRRCVIAMVSHDLGIDWPEAVALDPRITISGKTEAPDLQGVLYGRFQIDTLVGEARHERADADR